MRRKVIKLGGTTAVVSLPAKWVKKFELKAGDEIEVQEAGNDLVLSAEKMAGGGKVVLDISGLNKGAAARYIQAAYIRGYDEVEVRRGELPLDFVQNVAQRLIGFEVVEEKEGKVLIKDFGGFGETNIRMILRRCFLLILSMAEDGLEATKKNDRSSLAEIKHRDYIVNRFVYFSLRMLNRGLYEDFRKIPTLFSSIVLLENLGDYYANLCGDISQTNKKMSTDILDLWRDVNKTTRSVYEVFFKFDKSKTMRTLEDKFAIRERVEKMIESAKSIHEIKVLYWLRKVAEMATELLQNIMILEMY
jgi:phosphate uptake regulator